MDESLNIEIEARGSDCILPIKAQPGAARNELRGVQDGALKVCVTQIAEKGKANKAIAEFLAKALKLKKSQLTLLTGDLSSQKRFLVLEIEVDALRDKILTAFGKGK